MYVIIQRCSVNSDLNPSVLCCVSVLCVCALCLCVCVCVCVCVCLFKCVCVCMYFSFGRGDNCSEDCGAVVHGGIEAHLLPDLDPSNLNRSWPGKGKATPPLT